MSNPRDRRRSTTLWIVSELTLLATTAVVEPIVVTLSRLAQCGGRRGRRRPSLSYRSDTPSASVHWMHENIHFLISELCVRFETCALAVVVHPGDGLPDAKPPLFDMRIEGFAARQTGAFEVGHEAAEGRRAACRARSLSAPAASTPPPYTAPGNLPRLQRLRAFAGCCCKPGGDAKSPP